jgi:dihydroceramide fatty acyl 2-hydroxylase
MMKREKLFTSLEDVTPAIYETSVLERLTRMHYAVPFVFYTPVIIFFIYRALVVKEMSALHFLWLLPLMTFFWSFLEYVLHKHVLHRRNDGSTAVEMATKIHEAHHAYPNDSYRLAVHLWASIPGGFFFYFICWFIFGEQLVDAAFGTLVFYYLVYEFAHMSAHKINSKNPILLRIKKHHLKHHFQADDKGFGFTSGIWDDLFGTPFKEKGAE